MAEAFESSKYNELTSPTALDNNYAVALVTGAGAGIGYACVIRLVALGIAVVCVDRDTDKLTRLSEEFGTLIHPVNIDLEDSESVTQGLSSLPDAFHDTDILVNSAGHAIGGQRSFEQGRLVDWERIIETNVGGMLRVTHAVLPGMVQRDRGHIINLGSTASLERYEREAVYIASKHAVHGLSEGLRADLEHTSVRVTEILPGTVRSDFHHTRFRGDQAAVDAFADKFPGALVPDDVARVIMFALAQPLKVTLDQVVLARTRSR